MVGKKSVYLVYVHCTNTEYTDKMTIYMEKYDVFDINRPIFDIIRPLKPFSSVIVWQAAPMGSNQIVSNVKSCVSMQLHCSQIMITLFPILDFEYCK